MKQTYIERNFRPATLAVLEHCEAILEEYARAGLDLTLRQLYYQMIARDLLPEEWADRRGVKNLPKNYDRLGSIVNDGRMAGVLAWDVIVDRGRETKHPPHWTAPADIIAQAARQFRIDKWADQPRYVEVMCEKQAMEGVLARVCDDLDVPFSINRGYASQSFMREKGIDLANSLQNGKTVHVLYLGDHDPSGLDMDRDIEDRLRMFIGGELEGFEDLQDNFFVSRIALCKVHILKYGPPPNPAKVTDSRAQGYIRVHGDESWELDALDPHTLTAVIRGEVEHLRDDGLWLDALEREEEMRAELAQIAEGYDGHE